LRTERTKTKEHDVEGSHPEGFGPRGEVSMRRVGTRMTRATKTLAKPIAIAGSEARFDKLEEFDW